jgi:hypothetical protein
MVVGVGGCGGAGGDSGVRPEVEDGPCMWAPLVCYKKDDKVGVGEVILPICVPSIQRGVLTWHATFTKVIKMYPIQNNAGLDIYATIKVTIEELSSFIMVKG